MLSQRLHQLAWIAFTPWSQVRFLPFKAAQFLADDPLGFCVRQLQARFPEMVLTRRAAA